MNTTRLSSKGQIVIPSALRIARAWKTGTRFELAETAAGLLLKPLEDASPFEPTEINAVFGMARYAGRKLSVEDMNAAVTAEAARRK